MASCARTHAQSHALMHARAHLHVHTNTHMHMHARTHARTHRHPSTQTHTHGSARKHASLRDLGMLCNYRSKKYTQQKRPRTAAPNSSGAGDAHGVLTGSSRGTHGVPRGTHGALTGYSQVLTGDSRGTHGGTHEGTAKNCCQLGVQPTPRRTAAVGGPVPADRSAYSLNQLRDRRRGRCCVRVRVDTVRWSRSRLQCPRAFPGPRMRPGGQVSGRRRSCTPGPLTSRTQVRPSAARL
jgi:hypothetical protein